MNPPFHTSCNNLVTFWVLLLQQLFSQGLPSLQGLPLFSQEPPPSLQALLSWLLLPLLLPSFYFYLDHLPRYQ